jgi:hypothetical protein
MAIDMSPGAAEIVGHGLGISEWMVLHFHPRAMTETVEVKSDAGLGAARWGHSWCGSGGGVRRV